MSKGKVVLLNNKLKLLRKNLGLSQEAFCKSLEEMRLNVSLSTIKRAERGQNINYRSARLLAQFFNVKLPTIIEINATIKNDSDSYLIVMHVSNSAKHERQLINAISENGVDIARKKTGELLIGIINIHNINNVIDSIVKLNSKLTVKEKIMFSLCMKSSKQNINSLQYTFSDSDFSKLTESVLEVENRAPSLNQ